MPYFPPENWAEATIVVGYILAAIMYVLIPVVIPAGYGAGGAPVIAVLELVGAVCVGAGIPVVGGAWCWPTLRWGWSRP